VTTPYRAAGATRTRARPPACLRGVDVGTYLTNEVFLYRVQGFVSPGLDEIVEIEDCYWLDVVEVPMSDLRARALRVVAPATADP
jgi:hypothetical protein